MLKRNWFVMSKLGKQKVNIMKEIKPNLINWKKIYFDVLRMIIKDLEHLTSLYQSHRVFILNYRIPVYPTLMVNISLTYPMIFFK